MDTVGPRASFTLDEQLCFALHSASRAMTGCYRPLLEALGLTYSQYALLLVLWEHGAVSQGELGDRLFLDSGTLSPLLRRLESRGLVARHRRPEDERTVEVAVTARGAALRDRAAAVQSRVQASTGLSAEELGRMRDDLHLLADRLRRSQPGPLPVEDDPGT